jgi:spore coat protein U-like protein
MRIVSMRSWIGAAPAAWIAAALVIGGVAPASAQAVRPAMPAPSLPCSSHIGRLEFASPAVRSNRFSTFTAMITVTCAPETSFKLSLTSANGCKLRAGGRTVNYALFLDQAATNPLLDCGASKLEYSGKGSIALMIYGRTSALPGFYGTASYAAGRYSDDIDLAIESN